MYNSKSFEPKKIMFLFHTEPIGTLTPVNSIPTHTHINRYIYTHTLSLSHTHTHSHAHIHSHTLTFTCTQTQRYMLHDVGIFSSNPFHLSFFLYELSYKAHQNMDAFMHVKKGLEINHSKLETNINQLGSI